MLLLRCTALQEQQGESVNMAREKKDWGGRSAWALSFFDMVPPPTTTTTTESDVHADATAKATTVKQNAKLQRRAEADPQTRWRCRRCQSLLHPPLDVATGKPRSGVMMCEHLEGVSSGGTTHLATGVSVCPAGTLRYDRFASSASSSPPPLVASDSAKDGVTSTIAPRGQSPSAARDGEDRKEVVNLLRACQRAALADSRACSSISGGNGDGDSSEREIPSVRPPVPLLFVVVENPKTPANAGGILRAMKCYGVRGPADGDARADHQEETATVASSPATPSVTTETTTGGVLQRAGAFVFSGTRLRAAMSHADFASTLRTDPTHAGRDIPQLCLSSLDLLFDVLRSDYGHRPASSSSPSLVRVVAVELVEGATPLPAYTHPFCHHTGQLHNTDPTTSAVPMVFYVFGAEDGTLSAHHLDEHVDDVVFMPTTGSMNLAATVNVLLYDRIAKECCGLTPAAAAGTVGDERAVGEKWRDVFESRNTNNRTRWTRQS